MTETAAEPRGAAFFDLDRTIIGGSSVFVFGWVAYRNGQMTTRQLLNDAASAIAFKLTGASDEKSEAVRDQVLAAVDDQRDGDEHQHGGDRPQAGQQPRRSAAGAQQQQAQAHPLGDHAVAQPDIGIRKLAPRIVHRDQNPSMFDEERRHAARIRRWTEAGRRLPSAPTDPD